MSENITNPIVKKSNKNIVIIIGFLVTAFLLTVMAYAMSLSSFPSDFELTRVSSGGISGGGDTVEIEGKVLTYYRSNYPIIYNENGIKYTTISEAAARKTQTKPETYALKNDEAKELLNKIDEADFFNLDDGYNENQCCDMIGTTITITMNGETKEVSFTDSYSEDEEVPKGLIELNDYIQDLVPEE